VWLPLYATPLVALPLLLSKSKNSFSKSKPVVCGVALSGATPNTTKNFYKT
jgi:hypothetical protein